MKCAVLNVRVISGMIMRKWKFATQTLIGPPLANTMMNPRRNLMMKATDTRYYYNVDENLCADEDFVIYFLCGMEVSEDE